MSDPGGILIPTGLRNFTIFERSNIDIEFNLTDSEYGNNIVLGDADSYIVRYVNLATGANGTLLNSLQFIPQTLFYGTHIGTTFDRSGALVGRTRKKRMARGYYVQCEWAEPRRPNVWFRPAESGRLAVR